MGIPHMSWLEGWLEPILPAAHEAAAMAEGAASGVSGGMEWVLMALSVLGAGLGLFAGLKLYERLNIVEALATRLQFFHRLLENKWYIDEIYEALIVRPIHALSEFLWKGFDVAVIDRIVLGFGRVSMWTGNTVRTIQTGSLQVYALMLLIGLIATAGFLIYGWV